MIVCPNCGKEFDLVEIIEVCTNCGLPIPRGMESPEGENIEEEEGE